MCLAVPGKIIKIHRNQQATADFNGVKKKINISLVKINIGDFVMVHAGFAIEKVKNKEAEDIINLITNEQQSSKNTARDSRKSL